MRLVILLLVALLCTDCKIRKNSELMADENTVVLDDNTEAKVPILVVPPKDWQKGGSEFFAGLRPFKETHSDVIRPSIDRVFINQPIDLEKLGPGANVIFVTDGANWAFALSNGRFDSEKNIGSTADKTYPSKYLEKSGKYPWPVDHQNKWLPGSKLVTSNGPHHSIEAIIKEVFPSNARMMGGHVGVDQQGRAYIGYLSGRVSGNKIDNDPALRLDVRAMAFTLRHDFHTVISKAARGRGVEKVLEEATTIFNDVASLPPAVQEKMARYYPITGPDFTPEESAQSSLELLFHQLGLEKLRNYLDNATDYVQAQLLLEGKLSQNQDRLRDLVALIESYSFDLPTSLITPRISYENYQLLQQLIVEGFKYRGDVFNDSDFLPLAVKNGNVKLVEKLIASPGIDINARNASNETALILASDFGWLSLLEKLIASPGIDLNAQDSLGNTALIKAAEYGFSKSVANLIAAPGINPNLQDKNGDTALILAARNGHAEVVDKLIAAHGINLDAKTKSGKTALMEALDRKHRIIEDKLLAAGANTSGAEAYFEERSQAGNLPPPPTLDCQEMKDNLGI